MIEDFGEPWIVKDEMDGTWTVRDTENGLYFGSSVGRLYDLSEPLRNRIVRCVNFLAGVDIPEHPTDAQLLALAVLRGDVTAIPALVDEVMVRMFTQYDVWLPE